MLNAITPQTTVLQVQQVTAETLLTQIDGLIETRLKSFTSSAIPEPPQTEEYLTREQTAELLKVSKVTLWTYTKNGLLKAYRLGNGVRYLKSEVLAAPMVIESKKGGKAV